MNLNSKINQLNTDPEGEDKSVAEILLPRLKDLRESFEAVEASTAGKMRASMLATLKEVFPELAGYKTNQIKNLIKTMEFLAAGSQVDDDAEDEPSDPEDVDSSPEDKDVVVNPEDAPEGGLSPEQAGAVISSLDDLDLDSGKQAIIEAEASQNLENNPDFQTEAAKIDAAKDEVKGQFVNKLKQLLNQMGSAPKKLLNRIGGFFDGSAKRNKLVAKQEAIINQDPLKKQYYEAMAPSVRDIFRESLSDIDHEGLENFRMFNYTENKNDNAVDFYFSGFYLRFNNKEECEEQKKDDGKLTTFYNLSSPKARYDLVSPQGEAILKNIGREEAVRQIKELSSQYNEDLKQDKIPKWEEKSHASDEQKSAEIKELEANIMADPLRQKLYDGMSPAVQEIFRVSLAMTDQQDLEADRNMLRSNVLTEEFTCEHNYIITRSYTGFHLKLSNPEDCVIKEKTGSEPTLIDPYHASAKYNIISPQGEIVQSGLSLDMATTEMERLAADHFAEAKIITAEGNHQAEQPDAETEEERAIRSAEQLIKANPLRWKLYNEMTSDIKDIFRTDLVFSSDEDLEKLWKFARPDQSHDNILFCHRAGFYLSLQNAAECEAALNDPSNIGKSADDIYIALGRYALVTPDGFVRGDDWDYDTGINLLSERAKQYLAEKKELVAQRAADAGTSGIEPSPEPETEPDKDVPERPLTFIEQQLVRLNLNLERMKEINDFELLSEGQQYLVLRNLEQIMAGDAKEEAIKQYNEEVSGPNPMKRLFDWLSGKEKAKTGPDAKPIVSFSRLGKKLTRGYQLAKNEAAQAEKIRLAGLDRHKEYLQDLVMAVETSGISVDLSKEAGRVRYEINFFNIPHYFSEEEAKIAKQYNAAADAFSRIPEEWSFESVGVSSNRKENKKFDVWANARYRYNEAEEELMEVMQKHGAYSAQNENEMNAEILTNMNRSRSQIAAQRFLRTTEDVDEVLSAVQGQKAWKAMLNTDLGDKAGYFGAGMALRSVAVGMLGLAAIPAAASVIGAARAWNRGKKEYKEKDWLARRGGLETKHDTNLVRAGERELVYTDVNGDKQVKTMAGLESKLSSLYEKVVRLQHGETIYETRALRDDQGKLVLEETGDKDKDGQPEMRVRQTREALELDDLLDALNDRISYTEKKVYDGLVDFGSGAERLQNQLQLADIMGKARALAEATPSPKAPGNMLYQDSSMVQKRFRELLYFREKNISKSRLNNLRVKAATGAVVGAAFAFAGAKVRDMISDMVPDSVHEVAAQASEKVSKAARELGDTILGKKSNQGLADSILASQAKAADLQQSGGARPDAAQIQEYLRQQQESQRVADSLAASAEAARAEAEAAAEAEPVASSGPKSGAAKVTSGSGGTKAAGAGLPKVAVTPAEAGANTAASTGYEDEISNSGLKEGQHDSVWRSAKEIFKNHAEELGYKGDVDNADELNNWAELQAAKAINNTDNLTDKVFEGNRVVLEHDDSGYHVSVEQGGGAKPAILETSSDSDDVPAPPAETPPANPETPDLKSTADSLASSKTGNAAENIINTKAGSELANPPASPEAPSIKPMHYPADFLAAQKVGDINQLGAFDQERLLNNWEEYLDNKADGVLKHLAGDKESVFLKYLKEIKGDSLSRAEKGFWQKMFEDCKSADDKEQYLLNAKLKLRDKVQMLVTE